MSKNCYNHDNMLLSPVYTKRIIAVKEFTQPRRKFGCMYLIRNEVISALKNSSMRIQRKDELQYTLHNFCVSMGCNSSVVLSSVIYKSFTVFQTCLLSCNRSLHLVLENCESLQM